MPFTVDFSSPPVAPSALLSAPTSLLASPMMETRMMLSPLATVQPPPDVRHIIQSELDDGTPVESREGEVEGKLSDNRRPASSLQEGTLPEFLY